MKPIGQLPVPASTLSGLPLNDTMQKNSSGIRQEFRSSVRLIAALLFNIPVRESL